MSMVHRFLEQLRRRGLTVSAGAAPGELLLHGPREHATPEVLSALKKFKAELLVIYSPPEPEREPENTSEECTVCGKTITPDIRPILVDPLYCDRGGARATKGHPEAPRCPYKPSPGTG
jgi:hypothetical protein